MTVYKYFIKMALKNKWIIISYIGLFFIVTTLVGTSADNQSSFAETRLNIGIIDNRNSELSNSLKNYLEKENNIVDTSMDEEYIKEQIFLQTADAVIIIPEDFDEKVKNREESILVYKDHRKYQSIQVENQINKFLAFANVTYEEGEYDLENISEALEENVEVSMIKNDNRNNEASERLRYYFNYSGYVTIAIYIAVIGLVISEFTDKNISSRSRISSKKFLQFNKEMYLGQLTLAAVITSVFILGSILIYGKYIDQVDFTKHIINLLMFSLSIICLAFLITNITRNRFIINALSTVLSLGTSFISGVMVPQEILGDKVLAIAKFFPIYYFVRANDSTINSLSEIRFELLMQLLFAIAFLLIGLFFSKKAQRT